MGFENTAYGGTYNTPQTPHPPPPSYEQSVMNHNQQHNGLQRDSNMNASFCSTSSSATTAQSVSDSFIEDHQLLDKYQPNNQAYDTGAINLMNPNNNNYQPPQQQPYYPNPQQQPIPPHFQNQVVYPTLNPQPTQQQPPINQYYYPQQQPIKPSLPPIPQKTQPMSMNYQKPMPAQHQPMMMQPPLQQPMIHHRPPMQPVMMTPQQPTLIAQRTVTTTYTPPQTVLQPVFVTSGPVVTRQYPTGNTTTIVTTTTPTNMVQPVRVVHGPPPSMPPGAVGYSAYYPQHSVPVPSTTVYVQQKKKKSLFNKFVHGE